MGGKQWGHTFVAGREYRQRGLPIAVASYLLVRVESKLERLVLAITELTAAIRSPGTDDGKT